jgi:hypothetical protein
MPKSKPEKSAQSGPVGRAMRKTFVQNPRFGEARGKRVNCRKILAVILSEVFTATSAIRYFFTIFPERSL